MGEITSDIFASWQQWQQWQHNVAVDYVVVVGRLINRRLFVGEDDQRQHCHASGGGGGGGGAINNTNLFSSLLCPV